MSQEIPEQYSHSVKLETTAQGIRPHVHVYANNPVTAREQAINLYIAVRDELQREHKDIPLAPMEIKEIKSK